MPLRDDFRSPGNDEPITTSATSDSLLERVRRFDPDAWSRFSRLYSPLVYRWCRQARLQESDAADISQEVFRSVAGAIEGFHRGGAGESFRGWLWTITRNKLRDHFRRRLAQPGGVGGSDIQRRLLEIPEAPPDDGGFDVAGSLAHRALDQVECEFEPRTWQAFLRVTVGGQNPAAVSEDLQMTVGAVYTAKSRVLRRLRAEMEGFL
jgi:RNA polymerase sigma-70 factor (ECF subfamily)